jgi:hypothetical protein
MHYLQKLQSVKDNKAKTWKFINSLISHTTQREIIEEIVHNNKTIREKSLQITLTYFSQNWS